MGGFGEDDLLKLLFVCWKEELDDFDEGYDVIDFGGDKLDCEVEMDMIFMVDVIFLLLIFFMVIVLFML